MKYVWAFAVVTGLSICGFAAEAAASCGAGKVKPDLAGVYLDNFGGLQAITPRFWQQDGAVYEVCTVENSKRTLIAKNSDSNEYNPGKFSRFEWVEAENRLWYCQVVFNAESEAVAASAPPANNSKPSIGGCGSFPWSSMVKIRSY